MLSAKNLAASATILIALHCQTALAARISVPNDHATIAAALLAAKSGDMIEIEPGYYTEHGLVLPAGVSLAGMGDNREDTTIDGRSQGRILTNSDDSAPALVYNLTLQNGWARGETSYDKSGGAIYVNQGDVRIVNCLFLDNRADTHGGAIRVLQAEPQILQCEFRNNTALTGGGGALDFSYAASAVVKECDFFLNLASWGGAISCRGNSNPQISTSFFHGNRTGGNLSYGGGAVTFFGSEPVFDRCTFYGNEAEYGGALAALPDAPARLRHCTLTGNEGAVGGGIFSKSAATDVEASIVAFHDGTGITSVGSQSVALSYSDVHGNSAGELDGLAADLLFAQGNLSVDPLFCGPDEFGGIRFNLDTSSPCVAADKASGTMGAWLDGCEGSRGVQPLPEPPRVLSIDNLSAAPNPFNPMTRIRFELQGTQRIRAEIYGIDGRRVRILADQEFTAGWNTLTWTGDDDTGRRVGSGIYVLRLQGEVEAQNRKITLLK